MSVKRLRWILVTCLVLAVSAVVYAQSTAATLERLEIEFWPDFDRPSVLVLLTATLPEDAPESAVVVLPLPDSAELHAVAWMDEDGGLFTDIEYDDSRPGQISITATRPRFQVEYYLPYTSDGLQRSFEFEWRADLAVNSLVASVQQPAQAAELNVNPEPASVNLGAYGLQYHLLPSQPLPAGQAFAVDVNYTLSEDRLTQDIVAEQPLTGPSPLEDFGPDINIGLIAAIAGGLVLAAAVAWFVVSNRASNKRVIKPKPHRPKQPSKARPADAARFCHECGQPLEQGDRFCRNCGTPVKGWGN